MIELGDAVRKQKVLFQQQSICKKCGKKTVLTVYMTYMCIDLTFIHLFKWDRKYYAKSSCCKTVFSIPDEVGKAIRQKAKVILTDEDLILPLKEGWESVVCPYCGYLVSERFDFCPECGRRVKKYLL